MQQINVEDKDEEGDGDESEKRANRLQAESSNSEVLFWWPHEGRNNHFHHNVGPPKLFKKNKSPLTKTDLYWLLSYRIFYKYFSAKGGTDKIILSKILVQIIPISLPT